ncbi:MAG: ornithine carbamoyltransferase [Alphaproteobacteria bacterium]|nr:ornithine carbamoyltransferase [Alphaproteobacteria bacterium SS10]
MPDLLSLNDLTTDDCQALIARAVVLGDLWQARELPQSLQGRRIGLIAELPGWRNPTALSLGAAELGASCVNVTAGLEGAEAIADLAGYLDNWFDAIAIRTPSLDRLRSFAAAAEASVLNLRTNHNHPFETLGDLSFVHAKRGSIEGLRVAVVAAAGNIARSWLDAAEVLPIHVTQICPTEFAFTANELPSGVMTTDQKGVLAAADVIVTDCWPADIDPDQAEQFAKLRITADILDGCKQDVLFIPCPPVTRGQEVSADAMDHPCCVATQAKAFLMHAQNAFLEHALA